MRRIAASYLYTLVSPEPLRNAWVEYTDDGVIAGVGLCDDISREGAFIDGAVVPGFVNAQIGRAHV